MRFGFSVLDEMISGLEAAWTGMPEDFPRLSGSTAEASFVELSDCPSIPTNASACSPISWPVAFSKTALKSALAKPIPPPNNAPPAKREPGSIWSSVKAR